MKGSLFPTRSILLFQKKGDSGYAIRKSNMSIQTTTYGICLCGQGLHCCIESHNYPSLTSTTTSLVNNLFRSEYTVVEIHQYISSDPDIDGRPCSLSHLYSSPVRPCKRS